MRIMDCVLLLFQRRVDMVTMDPERPCVKPSWSEALKLMNNSAFLSMLLNFNKVRQHCDTNQIFILGLYESHILLDEPW